MHFVSTSTYRTKKTIPTVSATNTTQAYVYKAAKIVSASAHNLVNRAAMYNSAKKAKRQTKIPCSWRYTFGGVGTPDDANSLGTTLLNLASLGHLRTANRMGGRGNTTQGPGGPQGGGEVGWADSVCEAK